MESSLAIESLGRRARAAARSSARAAATFLFRSVTSSTNRFSNAFTSSTLLVALRDAPFLTSSATARTRSAEAAHMRGVWP